VLGFGSQVLSLLRRSLLSKSPISGICFRAPDHMIDEAEISQSIIRMPNLEEDSAEESKKLKVKFLVCKSNNKVVYTETGSGFVDLLFSFLTFSLGSVLKLLGNYSSIGCVGNLYKSVENLSGDCMKSDECKSMLLAPKLAPFFGCSNSLLPSIEMLAGSGTLPGCYTCFGYNVGTVGSTACLHGVKHVSLDEMNPKRPASKEVGGGYAKEAMKFMITDELEVTPFSAFASIQTTKKLEVTFNSLEEREIIIGETEVN